VNESEALRWVARLWKRLNGKKQMDAILDVTNTGFAE